jgi:HD superfamily phosphohydrolase
MKQHKMDRKVHLALYGTIDHGSEDNLAWNLYQTEALARLRDISLSSTPSQFTPFGMPATRFQHSVGVGYLANLLCSWHPELENHRQLLVAAALCHDVGSPPFSHIAEVFLHDLTGRHHEEQTTQFLQPGSELQQLLAEYAVDADEVVEVVTGKHSVLGPLMAGSIDLDNFDNSLHLLVSYGYHDQLPYHPLELLKAFRFHEGQVALDTAYMHEIVGWAQARRQLYQLFRTEAQLSSSSMLYRALEYAFSEGNLEEDFFLLTESDALYHLRKRSGPRAEALIEQAFRWKQYPLRYQRSTVKADLRIASLYADWRARKAFTDEVANHLQVEAHQLVAYVGRDKGEKSIELPFVGAPMPELAERLRQRRAKQLLAIFIHKDSPVGSAQVAAAVDKVLEQFPEAAPSETVFF